MGLTGLVLFGFIVGHLIGNLLIYAGPEALNGYALTLRHLGELLWVARIVLLAAVGAHILTAMSLVRENRRARPTPYQFQDTIQTTYAARTMAVSGLVVLAYIIYHLLHFTFRVTNPHLSHLTDANGHHDVYRMVVFSFQNPWICASYIFALTLLCMHLNHGLASAAQSLGANNQKWEPRFKKAGCIISLIIYLGYISIPIAIYTGIIKAVPGGHL